MTIDASIPLAAKGSEITPEGVVNAAQGMQNIALGQQHQRENEMKLEQQSNELKDKNAARNFDYSKYKDEHGNVDYNGMYSDLQRLAPTQAHDMVSNHAKSMATGSDSVNHSAIAQQSMLDFHSSQQAKTASIASIFRYAPPSISTSDLKSTARQSAINSGLPEQSVDTILSELPDDAPPEQRQAFGMKYQDLALTAQQALEKHKMKGYTDIVGKVRQGNPENEGFSKQIPGTEDQPTPTVNVADASGQPQYTTEGQLNQSASAGNQRFLPSTNPQAANVSNFAKEVPLLREKASTLSSEYLPLKQVGSQVSELMKDPKLGGPGTKLSTVRESLLKIASSLGVPVKGSDETVNDNIRNILKIDPVNGDLAQINQLIKNKKQEKLQQIYETNAKAALGSNFTSQQVDGVDKMLRSIDKRAYAIKAMSKKEAQAFEDKLSPKDKKIVHDSIDKLMAIDSSVQGAQSSQQIVPAPIEPPMIYGNKK